MYLETKIPSSGENLAKTIGYFSRIWPEAILSDAVGNRYKIGQAVQESQERLLTINPYQVYGKENARDGVDGEFVIYQSQEAIAEIEEDPEDPVKFEKTIWFILFKGEIDISYGEDYIESYPLIGDYIRYMAQSSDDLAKALKDFYNKLLVNTLDLDPEISKIVNDNFWDLV